MKIMPMLYLIEILHQTTTVAGEDIAAGELYLIEILHQTTTLLSLPLPGALLYLIEILHQTTTRPLLMFLLLPLYLIEILHQTTTIHLCFCASCILSKFYIKPQPYCVHKNRNTVVSYRNSTSNHNFSSMRQG